MPQRSWLPPHRMPLVRLLWDEDGDGKGDYIAVPDAEGKGFHIFEIRGAKPHMVETWYFPGPTASSKERM